ncbi:NAD-dependent protein deacetylase, SIR2 family [Leptolyngbya sp. PCC 7375]|nr:NAD-dependent protein deacetylase, SIR2 family [Leptolyngbya sp. PCC 7375]
MNTILEDVAERLSQAEQILFITGAGLSADSGLPTYRGVGGLYEGQTTAEGFPIEEALSGSMFQVQPDITWKYLWQIGAALHNTCHNRGHEVIAEIERHKPNTWVLTQNIDGFHRSAGSQNLVEIHGRASELYCIKCDYVTTAQDFLADYGQEVPLPPICPACQGIIRPAVVLFGEALPERGIQALYQFQDTAWDLVFAVGTSGLFPYIAAPLVQAQLNGIPTVEINPGETMLSSVVEYRIALGAAVALEQIWRLAQH